MTAGKKIEVRLEQDENAWLKLIGETGDLARMILKERSDHKDEIKKLIEKIDQLHARVDQLEEKLIPILTQKDESNDKTETN
jgi:phage shock protein A